MHKHAGHPIIQGMTVGRRHIGIVPFLTYPDPDVCRPGIPSPLPPLLIRRPPTTSTRRIIIKSSPPSAIWPSSSSYLPGGLLNSHHQLRTLHSSAVASAYIPELLYPTTPLGISPPWPPFDRHLLLGTIGSSGLCCPAA
ncbi:hypothetical protein CALVIDRAFT_254792 [Calocera viscosa TUFC12733]|uniref:Uncharacterized protein n=1 Tax=Calocera viscosa (strain TUFC12733) TaxID=1330018 RepID=A0A167J881_CALVF|nr:hypothetical protein CALVIDRAFT_254792 [Calocera viscosa TUFC12733]